jgi:hypothetical protein
MRNPLLSAGLVRGTDEGHRVTTFELFFDLVFVFAVTQVTAFMAGAHSGQGVLRGFLLLGLLWWLWSPSATSSATPRAEARAGARRGTRWARTAGTKSARLGHTRARISALASEPGARGRRPRGKLEASRAGVVRRR